MTDREMLDHFSDVLISDPRLLSLQERELLSNLLQLTHRVNGDNTVAETIARAVGETVAARMHEALGTSILQRLAAERSPSTSNRAQFPPRPPSPGPPSPGAGFATATAAYSESVLVAEPAEILPAHCVILEEFLPPQELENLIQDTLRHESEFHLSEVVSPGVNGGGTDFEHRRSRVLLNIGRHGAALPASGQACLPRILPELGHDTFPVSRVEAQITASNDGDFFRWHNDNAHEEVASREITFVYFFHREPKKFCGGELRIYDSRWQDGYVPTENYRNIVPRQNQLVVFPSCLAHEITLVDCPSRAFADSRFTVNGWFHR